MINWRKEVERRFDRDDWIGCVNYLKGELRHSNDMDMYLNLLYIYMYYLVDVADNKEYFRLYEMEIKQCYKQASDIYKNDDKYLFYVCFIASMSEWFLDLTMDDLKRYMQTLYIKHPENILYRWGYTLFCLRDRGLLRENDLAVINSSVFHELSEKSVLGVAMQNYIKYDLSATH
ncbi:hypothetical protein KG007_08845 [Alistipes sp. kh20]|uniref:hypothetical protein n=1 Tax=Alistipes montrealensis TaxID=2834113 RepID=UPI001BCFD51C|nr:hypothetical protein [Alistipes montrealensis]MBS4766315.1 hypothetical protein [Alistipes montrealensis]